MDWINDTWLLIMLVCLCFAGMWRENYSAILYGGLALGHVLFSYLIKAILYIDLPKDNPFVWLSTAMMVSGASAVGCRYLRNGIEDDIAFLLTGMSALCLFVNILCLNAWDAHFPMELFNPVFAMIILMSLAIVIMGEGGNGTRRNINHRFGINIFNKNTNSRMGLEN